MITAYMTVIVMSVVGLAFVLWYDYWYTPRHKRKNQ